MVSEVIASEDKYVVEVWPNGIGWNLFCGTLCFEVWPAGSVVKMEESGSWFGYSGVGYYETGKPIETEEEAVAAVKEAVAKDAWKGCGDSE